MYLFFSFDQSIVSILRSGVVSDWQINMLRNSEEKQFRICKEKKGSKMSSHEPIHAPNKFKCSVNIKVIFLFKWIRKKFKMRKGDC